MTVGNLRERLGRFVGRDAELAQLREAVRSSRLVTLTGPGGAGKTRLAVEAAAALRQEHPDGAWLVELAGVTEPDGVVPAAAAALGAAAAALASPQPAGSTTELIVRHLAGRSLVLVLDNCEHVIGAGGRADRHPGRSGARSPADRHQPRAARHPRRSPGPGGRAGRGRPPSNCSSIAPGPCGPASPPTGRPPASSRTSAAGWTACPWPSSSPPLAFARCRWPPWPNASTTASGCSASGARTALPRQQTLRAVVDWSYDLLFEDERRLFSRLATFTGGCGLTAAEAVCADEQVPRRRDPRCPQPAGRQVPRHCLRRRRRGPVRPAPDAVAVRQGTARRIRRSRRHACPPRGVLPAAGQRSPPGPARRYRADVAGPSRRGVGQPAGRARLVHRRRRCRRGAVAGVGDGLAVVHQRRLPRRSSLAR